MCVVGAWVISSGSHGGVSGLVGEAFREHVPSTFNHEPVALGITGWGVVDNNLSLMSDNVSRLTATAAVPVCHLTQSVAFQLISQALLI